MKTNAINMITDNFDVIMQSKKYQDYFKLMANSTSVPKHHLVNKKLGSRLDQKYLPNILTRYSRKIINTFIKN